MSTPAPAGPDADPRSANGPSTAGDVVCALSELRRNEAARVVEVDSAAPAGRRLLDLGFLPGTPVRSLRRAPLGDPVVYELRGYRVCLRSVDAAHVRVVRAER